MRIGIIGNGIIGLSTAFEILSDNNDVHVTIFGESNRQGSASKAAAAMLNSFAELEVGQLKNEIHLKRFENSIAATKLWKEKLTNSSFAKENKMSFGFGTHLISNLLSDDIECDNFDYIRDALVNYDESFHDVDPRKILGLNPIYEGRTSRAIFISDEGWVEPDPYMSYLENFLAKYSNFEFVFEEVSKIIDKNDSLEITSVNDNKYEFNSVLIANGSNSRIFFEQIGLTDENPKVYYGNGSTIRLKNTNSSQNSVIRTPNRGLACGLYSAPYSNGNMVIGATNNISEVGSSGSTLEEVRSILDMAQRELNQNLGSSEIIEIRNGWRPVTNDGVAMIGAVPLKNTYICTGTRREGWHLSPFIAKCLADTMISNKVPDQLSIYNPTRKTYRFYTVEQSITIAAKHYMSGMYQHGMSTPRGAYLEHIKNNYESFFKHLHEYMNFSDYGIPIEFIGLASQYYKEGRILNV